MKDALEYIVRNRQIKVVFQPIISLRDGSVLGYEALSRITTESIIENTDMMFNVAVEFNRLWELELLCRTKALESAHKFLLPASNTKLFINVNPHTMHDETFKKGFTKVLLEQYGITPDSIVFEITERNVIADMNGFKDTIEHYKGQDYRIAIDDAGAGYSGLNLISDVNPTFIKLDMNLIRNINEDSLKFALVKGMVEFSKVSNVQLIAEGIETLEEMDTLVKVGVQYGQGYLIQKPDTEIIEIKPAILQALKNINVKKNYSTNSIINNIQIKSLCTSIGTVLSDELISDVYFTVKSNPNCLGLCVVEDNIPIGIVTKEKLAVQLSGYYGFSLNQNKPISKIMDTNFLSVDCKMPVNIVSSKAMSRSNDRLYDFIVVTEDEKYSGVITIKDLLQKAIEIEVSEAKHQNPLSGLPGNLVIEQKLKQCVESDMDYSVVYFDINNFKAYNDVYGFENGDSIIKLLADILKCFTYDGHFIGHIGGDDFVLILHKHISEQFYEDAIKQFENEVLKFYNPEDKKNRYIISTNRRGEVEKFPLITLTAVMADNRNYVFKDVIELTERLAGLKKFAKQGKTHIHPA